MFPLIRKLVCASAVVFAALAGNVQAADLTLKGASLFDNDHAYSKTLIKFSELVKEYYEGEVAFDLRGNSELGIEPDYVNFLNQGAGTLCYQAMYSLH